MDISFLLLYQSRLNTCQAGLLICCNTLSIKQNLNQFFGSLRKNKYCNIMSFDHLNTFEIFLDMLLKHLRFYVSKFSWCGFDVVLKFFTNLAAL